MLTSRRNSKKRFKIRYFTHLVSRLIRITNSFYLLRLQIDAMMALPPFAIADFWSAFTAFHIIQLSSSLLALSHDTQPKTLSTLIQILSLLPDPKEGPYFRRFL